MADSAKRKGGASVTMTIEQTKDTLPDVRVSVLGTIITSRVSGRKERFATVFIPTPQGSWLNYQFSWETVARAVNSGKALKV